MRLALYQPDIPQNTGTMLRMAACLGVAVDIVEPAGFDVSDRNFRRAGLDYLDRARHHAPPFLARLRGVSRRARASPRARDDESGDALHGLRLRRERRRPRRPRIRRRAGRGPCGGGRPHRRADAAGPALAQRRGRGGDDPRRGAAADRRFPRPALSRPRRRCHSGRRRTPVLARDRARPPPAGRRADLVRGAARPHLRRVRGLEDEAAGAVRSRRDERRPLRAQALVAHRPRRRGRRRRRHGADARPRVREGRRPRLDRARRVRAGVPRPDPGRGRGPALLGGRHLADRASAGTRTFRPCT